MKKFFERFSRRTWIIIGAVATVLIIIIALSSGGEDAPLFQTEEAGRGNLVASVGATGSVKAGQSASLIWQTTGVIEKVNVQIGDKVSAEDVLASLNKSSLNQSVILAEADLAAAQKALDDLLNSDTAQAQAARTLDEAEKEYTKAYDYRKSLEGLINITDAYIDKGVPKVRTYKGYADAETISDADEKLALAKAKLEDAQRNFERMKDGADPADIAAAEARVNAAQATLNAAFIIAPFDGTVTQASSIVGNQVTAGQSAFRVDDLTRLLVDVQVSEVDINRVAIGQPATLTFDAILGKDSPYNGEVIAVSQAGDTIQGVVNFTVTVELTDADELVKPGMTSAVNIIVEEVQDVLLVPNRAVRLVDGERVVYVLRNGQPEMVEVQIGASSDTHSELVSGNIEEGDLIILNPPAFNGPFGG